MANRIRRFLIAIAILCIPSATQAGTIIGEGSPPDATLKHEVQNAIGRGLTWLASKQTPKGWWSQPEHPAITGLVLTAFEADPSGFYKNRHGETIDRGYAYLLSNVRSDGGIYGEGLANYNTSVSIMALVIAHRPEYEKTIRNARNFLIGLQAVRGEKGIEGSPYEGGIGYGDRYDHSDLSNTLFALEAIHYTQYLKNDTGEVSRVKDLDWKGAIRFIERTQNLPGSNDQAWASDDPENRGGFVYFPGNSKAGEMTLADGKVALRSYGSMSYAGLLSYIYADMDRDDPRVRAVYDWLGRHYSLDENPGLGTQGLYYYYHTMAKALNIYGTDTITLKDGKTVNWREDLAKRLIDLQHQEGFWVNENSRWWERDPVLVTSYAVITLEIVWRGL